MLNQDVRSLERAYEVRERAYLDRLQGPVRRKQNPDGDTVSWRLRRLKSWPECRQWLHGFLRGSVHFIRTHTDILSDGFDLAFDTSKRPAYTKKRGNRRRHRILDLPPKERQDYELDDWRRDTIGHHAYRGTKEALSYATLQALGRHRVTLACEAMMDCGNAFATALRRCLNEMADNGLRAGRLYVDREASNPKTLLVAHEAKQQGWIRSFVIAAKREQRMMAALEAATWLNVPYHFAARFRVVADYEVAPGVRMNLVELSYPKDVPGKERPNRPKVKWQSFRFWTDFQVTEANVWKIAQSYRDRWGIESGYREEKHSFPSVCFASRKLRRLAYWTQVVCLNLRAALNDPRLRSEAPELPRKRAVTLHRARDFLLTALNEHVADET